MTKKELKEMIRECLREELARPNLKEAASTERVWNCWFDGKEVGTVSAATSEEAEEKMMDKYPEYHYGLYDGCFWVAPEDDNLQEGTFTDAVKGLFGKKEEPIYVRKKCEETQALIDRLVNEFLDPVFSYTQELISMLSNYEYVQANEEFTEYRGFNPSSEKVIGLLSVRNGSNIRTTSPLSVNKHSIIDVAGNVLDALEATSLAKSRKLTFNERSDIEQAYSNVAVFFEIKQGAEDEKDPLDSVFDESLEDAKSEDNLGEGIFGNKYKGKTILAYKGNGKDEPVAICDSRDRNYHLITFAKAHAKKNNNKEADYKHVSATDMAVKRYGKALKAVPDVSAGLPAWVKQYEAEAREQAIKDSRAAEIAKEREEEARRREAARKTTNSKKSWEDDYTYVAGNGTGTYKYKTREGLEESLSVDNIFENLY